jgi:hypothetical protein
MVSGTIDCTGSASFDCAQLSGSVGAMDRDLGDRMVSDTFVSSRDAKTIVGFQTVYLRTNRG